MNEDMNMLIIRYRQTFLFSCMKEEWSEILYQNSKLARECRNTSNHILRLRIKGILQWGLKSIKEINGNPALVKTFLKQVRGVF